MCGQKLNEAKELVGHGNWLPWIELNCKGVSERQAQRYMKLAKSDIVSDLGDARNLRHAFILAGVIPDPEVVKPEPATESSEPAQPAEESTQQGTDARPQVKTAAEIAAEQSERGAVILDEIAPAPTPEQYSELATLRPSSPAIQTATSQVIKLEQIAAMLWRAADAAHVSGLMALKADIAAVIEKHLAITA